MHIYLDIISYISVSYLFYCRREAKLWRNCLTIHLWQKRSYLWCHFLIIVLVHDNNKPLVMSFFHVLFQTLTVQTLYKLVQYITRQCAQPRTTTLCGWQTIVVNSVTCVNKGDFVNPWGNSIWGFVCNNVLGFWHTWI